MADGALSDEGLVRTGLRGLRPESSLLLALSRPRLTAVEQDRIHGYLSAYGRRLDWGAFLDQACRHGVLPLVGRNLMSLRLVHSAEGRTLVPYRWIYTYAYQGNRRRNQAVGDEYAKVLRALNAAGIGYAIRKGPVLVETVYRDPGVRRMGDLDVLLRPDDFPAFLAAAGELGYRQGHLSRNAETVVPFDRRTELVWKVNLTHSTLPLLKPAHRDDVEAFVLDPCFSLFQARSGLSMDVGELLARAVDATHFGEASRALSLVDQIVDACVQLHVEATTLMYIEIGKDLTLLKFLDLAELLRLLSSQQRRLLVSRVEELGCGDSVAYALHHAALVYGDGIAPELEAAFLPAGPGLLDRYGVLDDQPRLWDRGFAERLFDVRRWQSLTARSTVPGPRAVV